MTEITVKCSSCTEKVGKGNILYELKDMDMPEGFPINGKFINGKCPNCGNKILIGIDN